MHGEPHAPSAQIDILREVEALCFTDEPYMVDVTREDGAQERIVFPNEARARAVQSRGLPEYRTPFTHWLVTERGVRAGSFPQTTGYTLLAVPSEEGFTGVLGWFSDTMDPSDDIPVTLRRLPE